MIIIPSLLVKTAEQFKQQIKSIQKELDLVQLDIADGKFANNTTWADPKVVEKNTKIDIELHLMVSEPLKELKRWAEVEQVVRILVHFESIPNLADIMPTLHAYGWEIGIVLNPETDIKVLKPYISEIKSVMFMGVVPGKQGQKLIPEVLEKIKKFNKLYPNMFTELDGGVNEKTMPGIVASGVEAVCPGSAIVGNKRTPAENIKRMKKLIHKLT